MKPLGLLRKQDVMTTVSRILDPYLGHTMAQAAAEAHIQKLGVDGLLMTGEQFDALIERIGSGLMIFVGRDKANQLVAEIRSTVLSAGDTA
jgi:hypothetical protein